MARSLEGTGRIINDLQADRILANHNMLDKARYGAIDAAHSEIEPVMHSLCANRDERFGNACAVRNLFEQVQQEHANQRSSIAAPTREELLTVEPADIRRAAVAIRPQSTSATKAAESN
jgi:hypothetical protein